VISPELPKNVYHARAWMRRSVGDEAGAPVGVLYMDLPSGGDIRAQNGPLAVGWRCVDLESNQGVIAMGTLGHAEVSSETCFDVDDVSLVQVPEAGLPSSCVCPPQ
jgi:hypothetical protein